MTENQNYHGPLDLDTSYTKLNIVSLSKEAFTRDGPRADVEYRDLGLSHASGGKIGAKHIKALRPFENETGWHWHDMEGHFVYILNGWISFKYQGVEEIITASKGDCLSQPAGVPHNVVGRSDDLELIEINLPANFGTFDIES